MENVPVFGMTTVHSWDKFSSSSLVFVNGRLLGEIVDSYRSDIVEVRFWCPVRAGSLIEIFDPRIKPGRDGKFEMGERQRFTLNSCGELESGMDVAALRRLMEGDGRMASENGWPLLEYKREFQGE